MSWDKRKNVFVVMWIDGYPQIEIYSSLRSVNKAGYNFVKKYIDENKWLKTYKEYRQQWEDVDNLLKAVSTKCHTRTIAAYIKYSEGIATNVPDLTIEKKEIKLQA